MEEKTTLTARRTLVNSLKSEKTRAQDLLSVPTADFIQLCIGLQRYTRSLFHATAHFIQYKKPTCVGFLY